MTRGRAAAALASGAVGLLGLAVLYGVFSAIEGAYLLWVAPIVGMAIGLRVWSALRRVCTTGSRSAELTAVAGIAIMPIVAYFGVSFGGIALLVPAALLAVAAVVTPRPGPA